MYRHMNDNNVHFASLQGHRPQNEDAHNIHKNIDNHDKTKKNINLYCIYDGHAGKEVSTYLRDNLTNYFTSISTEYPLSRKFVYEACDAVQNSLKKKDFATTSGSTALLVAHFKVNNDNYLNIVNVGDSRVIIERNGFALPLTKDHKPGWPEEYQRIKALGGKVIFTDTHRIDNLSVSRSFGDVSSAPFVTHKPEIFRYKIDKNDRFIVITCDGTIESMDSQDIINFVIFNCYDMVTNKRKQNRMNIARKLAEHAIAKGSQDNVSIIVVFFD